MQGATGWAAKYFMRQNVLAFICASCCLQAQASSDVHGVDDWIASDVQEFFKANGIQVRVEDLELFGIDGHAMLTYGDGSLALVFEKMKLTPSQIIKILQKVAEKRSSIIKAPADVFEFRTAHLRLVDYWIIPLLYSPRAALLWVRFLDKNSLIEKVNNEIDEIPLFQFWLKWTVCPSYPIYQIARKFDSRTCTDEFLEYNFLIKSFYEIIAFILLSIRLAKRDRTQLRFFTNEIRSLTRVALIASTSYYILYWFTPNVINHIYFYLTIYVLLPFKCISLACLAVPGIVMLLTDQPKQAQRPAVESSRDILQFRVNSSPGLDD